MFEIGFLPLINDHIFAHPPSPPTNNDRVCHHNAMPVSPQEKLPHYSTACWTLAAVLLNKLNEKSNSMQSSCAKYHKYQGPLAPPPPPKKKKKLVNV